MYKWSVIFLFAAHLTTVTVAPGAAAHNCTSGGARYDTKLVRRQWGLGDWLQREAAPWFQQHQLREADEVALLPIGKPIPTAYAVPMKVGTFDVQLLLDTGSADT